jgi:hydrogenase maturation protease
MKTLIIGLGNPILSDDGVGWKVVEMLRSSVLCPPSVILETASLGGLSLMERLEGYQRAILVDSMETGQSPVGSVRVFPLSELPNPADSHSASAHDTSLMTALETGRRMGLDLPEKITVVAIEATTVHEFSEELSPAVEAAVPVAVQAVLDLLKR